MPMNRRNFLNATSVASTVALSRAALAQNDSKPVSAPVSANDRIQVGCIGFGIMGQGDVQTATGIPGVELVAVADVYDGRLTLPRERYGDRVYTTRDYRELLTRPNTHAVIQPTPDH